MGRVKRQPRQPRPKVRAKQYCRWWWRRSWRWRLRWFRWRWSGRTKSGATNTGATQFLYPDSATTPASKPTPKLLATGLPDWHSRASTGSDAGIIRPCSTTPTPSNWCKMWSITRQRRRAKSVHRTLIFKWRTKTSAAPNEARQNLSKAVPAEAEFRQLIGNEDDGMLARFLQNKLKLMFWHRLGADPDLIFGAQLILDRVVDGLRVLIQPDPRCKTKSASRCSMTTRSPSPFRARIFRRAGSARLSPRKSATRSRIGKWPRISSIPPRSRRPRAPPSSLSGCSSPCSCWPSAWEAGSSSAA